MINKWNFPAKRTPLPRQPWRHGGRRSLVLKWTNVSQRSAGLMRNPHAEVNFCLFQSCFLSLFLNFVLVYAALSIAWKLCLPPCILKQVRPRLKERIRNPRHRSFAWCEVRRQPKLAKKWQIIIPCNGKSTSTSNKGKTMMMSGKQSEVLHLQRH